METTADALEIHWTRRQREVLDLLARGRTNGEIATDLGVSLAGAKWHVSEVLSKLGVASREEAAAYWRQWQQPHRRAGRALRGLLGVPALLKAGAGVIAAGTVTAAGLFVVIGVAAGNADRDPHAMQTQSSAEQALATNGVRDFTVEDATELAQRLGQRHLDTGKSVAGRPVIDGRPVDMTDLVLRERLFAPVDDSLEFLYPATAVAPAIPPSDRWGFVFEVEGASLRGGAAHFRLQLIVEDGTGTLVSVATVAAPAALQPDVDTMERAARGEDVGSSSGTMPPEESVPRPFATYDDDLRRMTLCLYGEPANPCLRFDDTATPDQVGRMCPANNLRGDVLYGLMSGGGLIVGTAAPGVTSVAGIDAASHETAIPLHPLPDPYAGTLIAFMGLDTGAESLELRGPDGSALHTAPLPRLDAPVVPAIHSIRQFGMAATGPMVSPGFDVPDSSASYAFILEFPEDGGPVRVVAECDAGTVVMLDGTTPLPPPAASMVVRFPDGSTRCALAVEAADGVPWRLYSK